MRFDWENFYSTEKIDSKRGTIRANGQYYVHDCDFDGINDNRAIDFYANSVDDKLLVEYSSFYNISSKDMGGALYLTGNGEFCLNRICGNNCYSKGKDYLQAHFCYISLSKSKNIMKVSSVSSCGIYKTGSCVCYFNFGKFEITKNNISFCKAFESSALCITNCFSPTICDSCRFKNNTSSEKIVIQYQTPQNLVQLSNCEILSNDAPMTVHLQSYTLTIENCTFVDNPKSPLFYSLGGKLIIVHCYLQNSCEAAEVSNNGIIESKSISTNFFDLNLADNFPILCNLIYKLNHKCLSPINFDFNPNHRCIPDAGTFLMIAFHA